MNILAYLTQIMLWFVVHEPFFLESDVIARKSGYLGIE